MKIRYSAFIVPHCNDDYSLVDDRFAINEEEKCFAIADGVTQSFCPGIWAEILCDNFVNSHDEFFSHFFREEKNEDEINLWNRKVQDLENSLDDIESFTFQATRDKYKFGASTFVGLLINESSWDAWALGDSYLIVLDKDMHIIEKVSSMDSNCFDNFPDYFASKKGESKGKYKHLSGEIKSAYCFLLMTDALAEWFIPASEQEKKELLNIKNHEQYTNFVEKQRMKNLKDDDTTLVRILIENKELCGEIILESGSVDNLKDLIKKEKKKHIDDVQQTTVHGTYVTPAAQPDLMQKANNLIEESRQMKEDTVTIEKYKEAISLIKNLVTRIKYHTPEDYQDKNVTRVYRNSTYSITDYPCKENVKNHATEKKKKNQTS